MKFTELDIHDEVLQGLQDMGFAEATPIQAEAIPIILDGDDLIAVAQTGTGKTAAFLIPAIDVIDGISGGHIKGLVLCPTRELAMQIDAACEGLSYHTRVSNLAVFGGNKGGNDFSIQKAAFTNGADIVIATPGRLLQHISLGYVDLSKIEFLILDEADRMLDMGFLGDIMRIISGMNEHRQTLMFSATMPPKIRDLAKKILHEPKQVNIAISKPAAGITQTAYCVYDKQKIPLITSLFKSKEVESVIVFASRKSNVDRIAKALQSLGLDARGMHSDRDQTERETIISEFRNRQFPIMIATDIMSRGIDIDSLSHVINYDVPGDPEDYVHRIGRTARADAKGEAITFINEDDMRNFARCEELIEREIPKEKLPEKLGEGPDYDPRSGRSGKFGGGGGRGGGGGGRGGGGFKGRGGGGGGGGRGGSGRGGNQGGGNGRGSGGRGGNNSGKPRNEHGNENRNANENRNDKPRNKQGDENRNANESRSDKPRNSQNRGPKPENKDRKSGNGQNRNENRPSEGKPRNENKRSQGNPGDSQQVKQPRPKDQATQQPKVEPQAPANNEGGDNAPKKKRSWWQRKKD